MTDRNKLSELLLSVIGQELPLLSKDEQNKIAEMLSQYIRLLGEGKIEEVEAFIRKNYDLLVKTL
jgi:hypothetical protein